ncbi:hypothetical protein TrVGV298_007829 [Trichoderma virens]|nr:hypothetical protein TrVGV298_007829 [Trichoderma virens]
MVAENWALDGPTIKTWLTANVVPIFYTWYGAVLLALVIFSLKRLPFLCTPRTSCYFNIGVRNQRQHLVAPHVGDESNIGLISQERAADLIKQHPLFQPVVVNTNEPQLETDLNLYQSASTFFSDLEVSRAKLMAQIIAPVWPMDDMEIEHKGRDGRETKGKVNGRPALLLGATQTSFKREIRPHTAYTIKSRILGWDSRWIYVGSWIHNEASLTKKIYATSLSKYIIKKGRITVRPEQFFMECGWISAQDIHGHEEEEMTSHEKVLLWSAFATHKDKNMKIVRTWGEAILLMEQEYED